MSNKLYFFNVWKKYCCSIHRMAVLRAFLIKKFATQSRSTGKRNTFTECPFRAHWSSSFIRTCTLQTNVQFMDQKQQKQIPNQTVSCYYPSGTSDDICRCFLSPIRLDASFYLPRYTPWTYIVFNYSIAKGIECCAFFYYRRKTARYVFARPTSNLPLNLAQAFYLFRTVLIRFVWHWCSAR